MNDYSINEVLKNIKNEIEKEIKESPKTGKSMECLLLNEDMVISSNKPKNITTDKINALAKIITYDIVQELGNAKDTQTIYHIIRTTLINNI